MNPWWRNGPDISQLPLEAQFRYRILNVGLIKESESFLLDSYVKMFMNVSGEAVPNDELDFIKSLPKADLVMIVLHMWCTWRLRVEVVSNFNF